ncbi:uncharacterized protein LOC135099522 [Scylla paramamosain]|uniref:uncharacterized protein LOC135095268 n=1 Tax=Scylla paramamosain TaxID=85552 RepID=UPI003082F8B1
MYMLCDLSLCLLAGYLRATHAPHPTMASNPHHLVKEFLEAIQHHPTAAAHRKNEQEKIRAYGERIQHVDQGSFTPLVFTTSGGMGSKAQCFYSRLADLMAEKKHQPRSHVVAWMRCRLSFSPLRSALLCLRGTRHSTPIPADLGGLDCEATVVESGIRVDRVEVE